jgi:hypothetical protein
LLLLCPPCLPAWYVHLQGKCGALLARLRPELLEEILHQTLLPSPPRCEAGGGPGGIAEACGVHPMLPDVVVSCASAAAAHMASAMYVCWRTHGCPMPPGAAGSFVTDASAAAVCQWWSCLLAWAGLAC